MHAFALGYKVKNIIFARSNLTHNAQNRDG
jgi:hypothetical protein